MRSRLCVIVLGGLAIVGLLGFGPAAYAAKKPKQTPHRHEQVPTPVPMQNGTVVYAESHGDACCDHKCCTKRERKCRHECAPPPCEPCIVYEGCPPPCPVEKVVTVTNPKTCCTISVVVLVPSGGCEKVDRDRDGDLELDYGKYEVSLRWKDGGRKLVVDYDD